MTRHPMHAVICHEDYLHGRDELELLTFQCLDVCVMLVDVVELSAGIPQSLFSHLFTASGRLYVTPTTMAAEGRFIHVAMSQLNPIYAGLQLTIFNLQINGR